VHGRVGAAGRQVIAVEGDVDVAERDLLVEEVADQPVQAGGEVRAAAMDADQRHQLAGVLLDDLVRYAYERPADVVLVEDDLGVGHQRFLPGLTGPG
jgi:methyl coenzyme M reductase gamma subunit